MSGGFFVPWNKQLYREVPRYNMELYTIGNKRPMHLAADGFHAIKKPFLSIPTPGGTIRMFLSAIKNKAFDEASGYISRQYLGETDIEELAQLFGESNGYQCYFSHKNAQTVSVALGAKSSEQMDILSMDIVEEPNNFGKWKIWRIIKE